MRGVQLHGEAAGWRRVWAWLLLACVLVAAAPPSGSVGSTNVDELFIDLDDRFADLQFERTQDGQLVIRVDTPQGVHHLTPQQFAEAIEREQEAMRAKGVLFVIFNITTWWGVLWVSVGMMGQLLFTLRMVLQWIASEKQHRSVVPVGFWWGSLMGGIMLLAYFLWRKDIVGILGQSTGAIVYSRNLWLIYFGSRGAEAPPEAAQAVAPGAAPQAGAAKITP